MTRPQPRISVVIPFYNEEGNVLRLFDELVPILAEVDPQWEIVAVDDGSTDGTAAELAEARQRHPGIRRLTFARNAGQTAAFAAGFRAVRGRIVATMDGDLQIDPRDLPPMIEQLDRDGVDLVHGWRRDRQDPWHKRLSTRIANRVRNWLTNESIPDTGCPLKVFRREVTDRFQLYDGMHRFFITLAHIDGFRSSQMIVRHRPRVRGSSKYGLWNRVFRALRDCLVVRWMMKRHLRYQVRELDSETSRDETPSVAETP